VGFWLYEPPVVAGTGAASSVVVVLDWASTTTGRTRIKAKRANFGEMICMMKVVVELLLICLFFVRAELHFQKP
jgi:hypothetical protein